MLILNPNLITDRTASVEVVAPGAVHRTSSATITLGGKGVDVARTARALGNRGVIVGFLPSDSADELARLAAAEGAQLTGVPVAGVARVTTILIERSGRVSVFNEPGPAVSEQDWDRLIDEVLSHAQGHHTLVCSGSLPPGSPVDSYARVVAVARRAGLRTVVDSTGDALACALVEHPDFVSPNVAEAESLVSGSVIEVVEPSGELVAKRATDAARALVARGARHAIVSAGSYGAAFSHDGETVFRAAPQVVVLSPIGAGDALVGGLVHALEEGRSWETAGSFALAVASASCEQRTSGAVDVARARALANLVGPQPAASVPGRSRDHAAGNASRT